MPQSGQETVNFIDEGWYEKNEMHGNVPVFDM